MSISHLLKTIAPRSAQYCSQLSELIKILKPLSIDGMSYSVYQDTVYHSRIRSSLFYSSEHLLGSYINDMPNWSESSFYENQKHPLHKSLFYCPSDPRYQTIPILDSPVWKINAQVGIQQSFAITLRDELQKKTELFWFYSTAIESHWIMKQIDNLLTINKFILYFKDDMESVINTPLLNKDEWDYFSKIVINKNAVSDNPVLSLEQSIDIPLKKYHLGYPFFAPLSSREFEVLQLYFSGHIAECSARILGVSKRTIEKHLENILSKSTITSSKELKVALANCPLFFGLIKY